MKQSHVLEGLTIVSMAEQFPGPFATMLMADMGAQVIIVERPGSGDPSRFLPPFFETLNRSKKSVALDIKQADHKKALIKLIKSADIFLEGFRPGKLAKAGLGYEALSEHNPKLIYASISGYGQTGPYKNRPGHDISYQGLGGALFNQVEANRIDPPSDVLLGDVSSALYATIGVLAALEARHNTGRGTYIDVAMSDTVTSFMTAQLGMALNGGRDLPAPSAEPAYDLFKTSDDRWISLSIAHEDNFWQRLCKSLDEPELSQLSRQRRVSDRAKINASIRRKISQKTFIEWDKIFTESDQMYGPVYSRQDVINDPHIQQRGLFETLKRVDGTDQIIIQQPLKFSNFTNKPATPSPAIGEHTKELTDLRHLSEN